MKGIHMASPIQEEFVRMYDDLPPVSLPYWLKQDELYRHLDKLPPALYKQEVAGFSYEGRPIRLLRAGSGDKTILLWSQMHGDEPTATRALLDLFVLLDKLSRHPDVSGILSELTLLFVPMLNPDGAERFKRRTAMGIDMNRDAVALRTPEARLLKSIRDAYGAAWGFNLHDQEMRYSAGVTGEPAAISLLAPAFDEEKEVNEVRGDALRLAAFLGGCVQQMIPGCAAKYDDTYEHRAFGDSMQRWNTRTVLIEAGYTPFDRTKEQIRKAIALSLLASFVGIADETLPVSDLYDRLPFNRRYFCEYIFRNAQIFINGVPSGTQDVGFYLRPAAEHAKNGLAYEIGLAELGDCSTFTSSYLLDASDARFRFFGADEWQSAAGRAWLPPVDEAVNCEISIGSGDKGTVTIQSGIASGDFDLFLKSRFRDVPHD